MPALNYGPELTDLLSRLGESPLDAGQPLAQFQPIVLRLAAEPGRFAGWRVVDPAMASACLAGIWLRLNELDASHRISQDLHHSTGSYWHAIMHRREGDFGNSKYWFRQVGQHPAWERLIGDVRELTAQSDRLGETLPEPCRAMARSDAWDPFRFVDLCEAVVRGRLPAEGWCRQVQHAEWQGLFDVCFSGAVSNGRSGP